MCRYIVVEPKALLFVAAAGAYTRPLFSSTSAVSDTEFALNTP